MAAADSSEYVCRTVSDEHRTDHDFTVSVLFRENAILLEATDGTEAWTGEVSEQNFRKNDNSPSWPSFRENTTKAFKSRIRHKIHVKTMRGKEDLDLSWANISNGKDQILGAAVLHKSADPKLVIRNIFMKLAEQKRKISTEKSVLESGDQTIQMDFENIFQEIQPLIRDRQKEIRDILATTKLLVDSKREYQSRLDAKAEYDKTKAEDAAAQAAPKEVQKKGRKRKM